MKIFRKDLLKMDGKDSLLIYLITATRCIDLILTKESTSLSEEEYCFYKMNKPSRLSKSKPETLLGFLEIFYILHYSSLLNKFCQNKFPIQFKNTATLFSNKPSIEMALLIHFYGIDNLKSEAAFSHEFLSNMAKNLKDQTSAAAIREMRFMSFIPNSLAIKIAYGASSLLLELPVWSSAFEEAIDSLNQDAKFDNLFVKELTAFLQNQNDVLIEKISTFAVQDLKVLISRGLTGNIDKIVRQTQWVINDINKAPLFDKSLSKMFD